MSKSVEIAGGRQCGKTERNRQQESALIARCIDHARKTGKESKILLLSPKLGDVVVTVVRRQDPPTTVWLDEFGEVPEQLDA